MSLPATGYVQQVEVVVGGTLPRAGFVQPVEIVGGGGGSVTGGGTPPQVAVWDGATSITGYAGFTYDSATTTLTVGSVALASAGTLKWSTDLSLNRAAAGVLEQKDGTNAQSFRIYGTTAGPKYLRLQHDGTDAEIGSTSGNLILGADTNTVITFRTNGTARFFGSVNGLYPNGGNAYDLGDVTNTWRTVYAGTSVITPSATVSGLTATRVLFAGTGGLISDDAGMTYNSATDSLTLAGALTINGHQTWTTDNTFDIGASGATRPKTAYVGTRFIAGSDSGLQGTEALFSGGTSTKGIRISNTGGATNSYTYLDLTESVGVAGATMYYFSTTYTTSGRYQAGSCVLETLSSSTNGINLVALAGGIKFWTSGFATHNWAVNSSGHFLTGTDNTYDIGGSLASRPRTGYFGTSIIIGPAESTTISGQLYVYAAGAAAMVVRDSTGDAELFAYVVAASGGILGTSTAHNLTLRTSNTNRWVLDQSLGGGLAAASNLRLSHGTSALATNATEGFFHLQSCAGTPTGVPASIPTGQIPLVWDSTNNLLYAYDAGWVNVSAGGGVTGSGSNTQVVYWTGASTVSGDAGMTYDAANDRLVVAGRIGIASGVPDVPLHIGTGGSIQGQIRMESAGGTNRQVSLYVPAAGGLQVDTNSNAYPIEFNGSEIRLWPAASNGWTVNGSKHIVPTLDNSYDIGVLGGNRPKSVIISSDISVGTNPGTAGPVRIPYNAALTARNGGNSSDITLIQALTINSVANVLKIGDKSNIAHILFSGVGGNATPTTSDLATEEWALWNDGGNIYFYVNDGGVIRALGPFA